MKYINLINNLKNNNFNKILVTGAHRSGTTFAAAAIAHDLNMLFYPEENILGGNLRYFSIFNNTHNEFVLQAPGISSHCHNLDVDVVIFMNRDPDAVIKSMHKLSDNVVTGEFNKILRLYGAEYTKLDIQTAKLKIFTDIQRKHIKHSFILEYESLKDHPYWVNKVDRIDWNIRQITPSK